MGNIYKKKPTNKVLIENFDYWEHYVPMLQKIPINPEFIEVLKKLKKDNLIFINTSTESKIIAGYLEKYDIVADFKEILGCDKSRSKIEKFEYLLDKYDLQPADCVFITDTVGDVLEARKVGVKSIAVDFGFHSRKTLEAVEPYKIISSLIDLKELL